MATQGEFIRGTRMTIRRSILFHCTALKSAKKKKKKGKKEKAKFISAKMHSVWVNMVKSLGKEDYIKKKMNKLGIRSSHQSYNIFDR